MTWSQNYDPLHSWPLSTLVSALPVLTLFFVLLACRARVWVAALCGLLTAVALALFVFGMPAEMVAGAAGLGAAFGLTRIAWIIVASIFLYHVAVETRPVSGDEAFDRGAVGRQAAAARPGRVLLRSLSGGDRRRRRAGGHHGRFFDRAGLRSVSGGHVVPDRQHGAGRLGCGRHADSHVGRRERPAGTGPERHGRPNSAAAVVHPAVLAGAQHGRLAANIRGLARLVRQRRLVRSDAILLVELSGVRIGRRRRRAGFAADHGACFSSSGSRARSCRSPTWPPSRIRIGRVAGAPRVVAVSAGLGLHLSHAECRRSAVTCRGTS